MFYEAAWAQDYAAKIAKPRLDHPTKRLSCRKDFEKGKPEGKKKKMIARPGNPEVLLWSRVLAHGADDMHAGEDPDCEPPPGHTLPRCLNAQAACK
jgi:hypothetical protein